MTSYIHVLRGINVSGQRIIKMDQLRKMYENLGFRNVKTYLQSGNVVFQGNDIELAEMEKLISGQIAADFGFQVPVIALTVNRLKKIIAENPFPSDTHKDQGFMHVTFLSAAPSDFNINKIDEKKQIGEEVSLSENAVFLYCPHGYGKTRLSNNFLEVTLHVTATTRNWRTVTELLQMAEKSA
jgi:uncharacterized protein (DUF1697 family)